MILHQQVRFDHQIKRLMRRAVDRDADPVLLPDSTVIRLASHAH